MLKAIAMANFCHTTKSIYDYFRRTTDRKEDRSGNCSSYRSTGHSFRGALAYSKNFNR
jgi:hypothetical protein